MVQVLPLTRPAWCDRCGNDATAKVVKTAATCAYETFACAAHLAAELTPPPPPAPRPAFTD